MAYAQSFKWFLFAKVLSFMEDQDRVCFKNTHGIVDGCLRGEGIGRLN